MNKTLNLFTILCVCYGFFATSCNFRYEKTNSLLEQAENILDKHPNSTLHLLDSIIKEGKLSNDQHNKYLLLRVSAKHKTKQDISLDTIIFSVKKYYQNKKDDFNTFRSAYYSGLVLKERKQHKEAMESYMDAQQHGESITDENLKGLLQSAIGELYYIQLYPKEAIEQYKKARIHFLNSENYKNQIKTCNLIGSNYLLENNYDSCFAYFNQALLLAKTHNDSSEYVYINQNMGIAYKSMNDINNAKKVAKHAISYSPSSKERVMSYCNLANIFLSNNQNDSARIYTNMAINETREDNTEQRAIIYGLLANIEKIDGNHEKALEYKDLFINYLKDNFMNRNKQVVHDVQKKYDFEVIQNINNRLLIEKQWYLLATMTLVLIILIVVLILYKKNLKNKAELLDAEHKILHMKEMAKNFNHKEKSFRNVLIQHFDILKKAALLEGYLKEEDREKGSKLLKKFNEVVYGQENMDWNQLYKSMNEVQNGFFDKIQTKYPELDELEFRICCMSYAGLNNTEISIITKLKVNTIHTKKSSIRRKLGIKEYGSFFDFFNENCPEDTY
ncbi:DNA-binding CsgD family transcriptional regulator [Dysgonomonas sp. PH5-45]|uniref:tetratricopeptide repeat protein n=1 Tax=unclassified Dysgonomonas TaxID=2630389 RepID=UPI00247511B8|nr:MULTISPECIES: hypothetical protein [unclassified Dysgonomonas]MDH6354754.1 DNA-binding CsgD family transcriptional regulator [Dysgonomonas sp. PH5-45]MDH6387653.1 DNA-binding CsgD family transcriptional regulator [Dysgonomonas sp. PH5-37]